LALGAALQEFVAGGRLVMGICNGFQVLVILRLLPGLPGREGRRLAALLPNDCGNFRDAWVHLKALPSQCVFTQGLDLFQLPIRHGEGKFYAEPSVLRELWDRGQIALKYATPEGEPAAGRFPENPNGSLMDIAGVCDATGRVLGPHQQEVPQIGHQHLAVFSPVAGDLFSVGVSQASTLTGFTSMIPLAGMAPGKGSVAVFWDRSGLKRPPSGRPAPRFFRFMMHRTLGLRVLPTSLSRAANGP
jgi:hypothetical protein